MFPIERRTTREVFEQCRRAGIVQVVAGDLERRIRLLYVEFRGGPPAVAVAGGGPAATDDELVATMDELTRIGRRLAPTVGYAHISIRPTFLGTRTGTWRGVVDPGGLHDELVLDAMPWQLLGRGHLRRLDDDGALPLDQHGLGTARHVAPDMVELIIGHPADWLPGSSEREGLLGAGRRLLGPCLPSGEERDALILDRWARQRTTDT